MTESTGSGFGLSWAQDRVRAFHEKAGHPIASVPAPLGPPRSTNRIAWMREEIEEFEQAESLVDQADAIVDLMYFALGTLVEMGVEGEALFEIVHRANMRKISEGGVKIRETDGKIQKPLDWVTPESEIAAALVAAHSRFQLVVAEDTDSGAAALAMMAAALGEPSWSKEFFTSNLPPTGYANAQGKGRTRLFPGALTAHLHDVLPQLEDDFVPIEVVDEAAFQDLLEESFAERPGVVVGYQLGQAYRTDDPRSRYALAVRLVGNKVVLIDPGPDDPGVKVVHVDDLYAAVKSAMNGVHRVGLRNQ